MARVSSRRSDVSRLVNVLPDWLIRAIGFSLGLLLAVAVLRLLADALAAIRLVSVAVAVSLLLAALLFPLSQLLRRNHLPAWLAALLTLLAFLVVVLGSIFWLVRRALTQLTELQAAFAEAIERLEDILTRPPLSLSTERVADIEDRVVQGFAEALPTPAGGATMVAEFLSGTILSLFLLFFFLKDGGTMWNWVVSWVPHARRQTTDEAGRRGWQALTLYMRGTTLVALVDALGIGASLLAVGNPLTASLTVVTFIGAYVPLVGATVSGALAVALTLVTVGFWQAVFVLAAVLAVQQIEGHLLQPFIMGKLMHLSPVAIVLAISVGVLVAGIIGAIVAVPVTATAYRVAQFLVGREEKPA